MIKECKILLGLLLVISTFFSCKKFVEVKVPKTQLFTDNTFNNNGTATAALTSIYSQISNDQVWYFVPLYTGISGDELSNYATLPDLMEYFKNNIRPINPLNLTTWSDNYRYIYQANSVLEGLQMSTGVNENVKKQLMGEAKLIRAFSSFTLANLYGDVPIVLSTDYKLNANAGRSKKEHVFNQIITDLTDAKDMLNANYVSSDDTTITLERVRPNKSVAAALLAKLYLYKGDWAAAEAEASSVISQITLYDTVPLNDVFLKNSKEAIWQLLPVSPGYNTPEGKNFILIGPPIVDNSTFNCSVLSPQLMNAFESGDLRRINWVKDTVINSLVYSYPYKYKIQNGLELLEYSTLIRLSEIYLIRSEARAQQGKLVDARVDLNIVRARAGLPSNTTNTQSLLLSEIYHERQVELFTEGGNRWFDLKRTNSIDTTMNQVAVTKNSSWTHHKQLFPIPQNERNNDPNLTQNDGY